METTDPLFECKDISKYFGGLKALSGVSFNVWKREIVGIIGPNGAGKTTLFNVISGIFRPTSGVLRLEGRSLLNQRPYMICGMGIGRTYQTVRPFLGFTALQNVVAGVLFGKSEQNQNRRAAEERAAELLLRTGNVAGG